MPQPDRCAMCGTAAVPLEAAHVLPRSLGGSNDPSNIVYLCPNCHQQIDRGLVREFEFIHVIADLMQRSGAYSEVTLEPDVSATASGTRLRPDILAVTARGGRRLLVECKSSLTVARNRLGDAINQLARYQAVVQADEVVLALPARLTPDQRNTLAVAGIQAWDLDAIAARFRAQLDTIPHPLLRPLLLNAAALAGANTATSVESALLNELQSLPPGRTTWTAYQRLISRILERLFCPPLSSPILELSDEPGVNRRDIILPNYADAGFWAFVRARYCADFIVADAKNHTAPVGKSEAIQMINYLKRHGAGLLGLILSRLGPDQSCLHTIRESWGHEGKLVVVFSDDHVERMLRTKEAGGPPEDVIREWIEDFRLAL